MGSKFKPGDRVRVTNPYWHSGNPSNALIKTGTVGVIETPLDYDGDYFVQVDTDGRGGYVGEENLELEVATPVTRPINVEVRFFVDGKDVTDAIKTLFI